MGKIVLLLTSLAIFLTSDLPLALLAMVTKDLHLSADGFSSKVLMIMVARPVPITLLALGVLNLWLYKSRCLGDQNSVTSAGPVFRNSGALSE